MTPGKRLKIFTVALFAVFTGLSTYCYGADCGFGSCPNTVPPCYRVTFDDGHALCGSDSECEDWENAPLIVEGSYMFTRGSSCYWAGSIGNYYDGELYLPGGSGGNLFASPGVYLDCVFDNICGAKWFCNDASSDANGFGGCDNDANGCCVWSHGNVFFHYALGGSATGEPVWDCSACDFPCDDINTGVLPPNYDEIEYLCRNPLCCPVRDFNDYELTIYTNDSNVVFVVPDCDTSDPCIATVTSEPNACTKGKSVTFTITPHQGIPPAEATITCTASFYTATGDTNSRTVTITVKPEDHECCEDPVAGGGGCSGKSCIDGGGGGGGPPHPGEVPGPVLGTI